MNDALIERIKKLLALAGNNPNEHEAQLAMERAKAIALENEIDIAKLNNFQSKEEKYTSESIDFGKRSPIVSRYITNILEKFFRVRCIRVGSRMSGMKMAFIGKTQDIETAMYIFSFLQNAMTSAWQEYYDQNPHSQLRTARESYYLGFYNGLCGKLRKIEEQATQNLGENSSKYALMCKSDADKLNNALSQMFGRITQIAKKASNSRDINAYSNGFKDGESVNLSKGVGSSRPAMQLH